MFTLDDCPHPAPGVVGRVIESAKSQTEAVLILAEKGQVKVINEVGARIWELLDGQRSVRQMAAIICQEYQVDQPQAEIDTLAFITDLHDRGIVTIQKS
jgi:hypothetical protein